MKENKKENAVKAEEVSLKDSRKLSDDDLDQVSGGVKSDRMKVGK